MAKINQIDFNLDKITFNCNSEELHNLNFNSDYLIIDKINFNLDKLKIVKRGKTENTYYILINKFLKELIIKNYKQKFIINNNILLESAIITNNDENYIIIKL